MVTPEKALGCIEKVNESVENMKETYLIANIDKTFLLHPEFYPLTIAFSTSFPDCKRPTTRKKNHICIYCHYIVKCTSGAKKEEYFMNGKTESFVKGVSTYIIMDNLEVMPKTTISILFLIKSLGVKDSPLKEKVVVIGKEQSEEKPSQVLLPVVDDAHSTCGEERRRAGQTIVLGDNQSNLEEGSRCLSPSKEIMSEEETKPE
ncbi:hypothetical protein KSP39_PZI003784 [Platanthera zijinensis]|uniref:Uncharacterized protein n=1 Tax=Platanthera zijinensis TaxID=2320716 RepID=A0AAP0GC46_9ASPA